jgi:hypothetical protein
MKKRLAKLVVSVAVLSMIQGTNCELMAANIDLGLQLLDGNILADRQGNDLGDGQVFFGNWNTSVGTNYASTLASLSTVSQLSSHFTIALSTTWSGLNAGKDDEGLYTYNIADDTGLATRFIDAVFFNVGATQYGSIRWNSAWPGTEDTARGADFALVVPSADDAAAPAILVGSLTDNLDGTGKFQTIPEPSSTTLFLGAASLLFFVRNLNRRIACLNN